MRLGHLGLACHQIFLSLLFKLVQATFGNGQSKFIQEIFRYSTFLRSLGLMSKSWGWELNPRPARDFTRKTPSFFCVQLAKDSNSNQRAAGLLRHLHDKARARCTGGRLALRENSAQHFCQALFFSSDK